LDNFTELEAELEAELETRTQQYEYYRNKLLDFSTGLVGVPKIDKMIKEFCSGGVDKCSIDEMIDYIQPTKYIVKNNKYSDEFSIPVLTAGKSFILGFTNETDGVYEASNEKPVVIFDDFTTSLHWVNFPFKVKSSALKILIPKSKNHSFRYLYYSMKALDYKKSEGTHERHWISKYSQIKISMPPLEIQNEIVKILDSFSELVTSISEGLPAEIKARKQQYEYYRNKLLTFEERQ
jgi:type I restriction enzyme S subunit